MQILSGCLIATILAIGLGLSIYYNFYYNFPIEKRELVTSATTPAYTYTHPGTTTTQLTTAPTVTAGIPAFYMEKVVELDPSLKIELCNTILLSDNVTKIAETLAKALDEAPVKPFSPKPENINITVPTSIVTTTLIVPQPTVTQTLTATVPKTVTVTVVTSIAEETILQHISEYTFQTSKNSTIRITFIDNRFYQLTYASNERIDRKVETLNPNFNPIEKIEYAKKVASSLGIKFDLLDENFPKTLNPNIFYVSWTQKYKNVTVATLSKDWAGNHVIEYSTISFTFYPETGKLISLTILSPYWYTLPSNFTINISPKEATTVAKDYATKYMQINEITSTQTNFIIINSHLYYIITVYGKQGNYYIIVNPRTGEVGFPKNM